MRRVRVVQVGPDLGVVGGISAVASEIVAVKHSQVEFTHFSTWKPDAHIRSIGRAFFFAIRLVFGWCRVDVVHVHLSERGSFIREGLIVGVACRAKGIPAVATLHGAELEEFVSRHKKLCCTTLSLFSSLLCLGPGTEALLSDLNLVSRIVQTLNPIADERIAQCANAPWLTEPNKDRILFAGEIGTRKGFDRLLKAWELALRANKQLELVVCGPVAAGYELPSNSGFSYLGELTRDQVQRVLQSVGVVCLPSRAEVLPMIVIEALAQGVEVVTTDVGEMQAFAGCPAVRILDDKALTATELAEILVNVLDKPVEERSRVRQSAILWTKQNTASSKVVDNLVDIYLTSHRNSTQRSRKMPISKNELSRTISEDLEAQGLGSEWKWHYTLTQRVACFQRRLRITEYWHSQARGLRYFFYYLSRYRLQRLSEHCGFDIPLHVFSSGLSIAHRGSIVVNSGVRVGKRCRIHQNVTLGAVRGESPVIEDDVLISPGAGVFGPVRIGSGSVIGPSAVVTSSVPENSMVFGPRVEVRPRKPGLQDRPEPKG